jgi:hypothetical protein
MVSAILKDKRIDKEFQEFVDFVQSIDFTEFFERLKAVIGTECDFTQPEISFERCDVYISCLC